jgi:hypothetical protein
VHLFLFGGGDAVPKFDKHAAHDGAWGLALWHVADGAAEFWGEKGPDAAGGGVRLTEHAARVALPWQEPLFWLYARGLAHPGRLLGPRGLQVELMALVARGHETA